MNNNQNQLHCIIYLLVKHYFTLKHTLLLLMSFVSTVQKWFDFSFLLLQNSKLQYCRCMTISVHLFKIKIIHQKRKGKKWNETWRRIKKCLLIDNELNYEQLIWNNWRRGRRGRRREFPLIDNFFCFFFFANECCELALNNSKEWLNVSWFKGKEICADLVELLNCCSN